MDDAHPRIRRLKSLSCPARELRLVPLPLRLMYISHFVSLAPHLKARRPDLVVISQGDNYDWLHVGSLCRRLGLPYTLISQKATDHFWPHDGARRFRRPVYEAAARCFFVSEQAAWERRHELREMGLSAARRIRETVPPNPAEEFADTLLEIANAAGAAERERAEGRRVRDEGPVGEQP